MGEVYFKKTPPEGGVGELYNTLKSYRSKLLDKPGYGKELPCRKINDQKFIEIKTMIIQKGSLGFDFFSKFLK